MSVEECLVISGPVEEPGAPAWENLCGCGKRLVEVKLMSTATEEYLKRIKGTQLFAMTSLHYQIMERIATELGPRFELDDLLRALGSDIDFCESKAVSGNIHRVRLFALQTLQALVAVGMIRQERPTSDAYQLTWPSSETPPVD